MARLKLFVTGTDTGCGKTTVAVSMARAFAARGLKIATVKPVAAGCRLTNQGWRNDDAERLAEVANVNLDYAQINPIALVEPIAPHIAAEKAGITISVAHLAEHLEQVASTADVLLVEGAGGWKVPLNDTETLAELAVAAQLSTVLVVGLRLGCINHALLTAQAIMQVGVPLAGWIANETDPVMPALEENVSSIKKRLAAPLLARFPNLAGDSRPDPGICDRLISHLLDATPDPR
ncbi:MAG: dethiobiotin synthase [Gammaproteobacteria bacterium]|nr:dethiobiotin synthase [Gammaproteobacteria bacterium]